ncbi:hypothetical protein RFI_27694 [Reticulomyxa filosa]|uniref:Uncharacterized protein n=1 Tax=Reticulomyxa filosa TaxID=46433 RepID=X6M887_RETFI|nr:hypothetical protein RFI_27694 [Reticulomyxa filosa]|eukprot:ETO09682.1 hypothetical protein RFI_27694 [Reticulomyxa filosa]
MIGLGLVLLSNVLATIVFLFGNGTGSLNDEAETRCAVMQTNDFYGNIVQCHSKVKHQLFWEVCFVLVIYIIVSAIVIGLTYRTYLLVLESQPVNPTVSINETRKSLSTFISGKENTAKDNDPDVIFRQKSLSSKNKKKSD